jgi:AcrR family transcriptional regulator
MPRSRAATRLKIVEGAYELFYSKGFARVSMDAIAASAGVTKRTLYAHYDSKDTLLADVLEHHGALALERIEKWARKLEADPDGAADKLFSELALWSASRSWSGAGFTRLVMELADLPGHPARAIARRHKAAVQARLAAAFGCAAAGAEVMLLLEGAVTLLLVHGDRRYAEIAAAAAKALIHRHRA